MVDRPTSLPIRPRTATHTAIKFDSDIWSDSESKAGSDSRSRVPTANVPPTASTGSRRNVCSFDSEPDSEPAFDSESDQISESNFDTGVRRRARSYGQAGGSVDPSWS